MTINKGEQVEVVTSIQRRRRWEAAEKRTIVQETYEPGMTVSAVAGTYGLAPNQVFDWRRRLEQGVVLTSLRFNAGMATACMWHLASIRVTEKRSAMWPPLAAWTESSCAT